MVPGNGGIDEDFSDAHGRIFADETSLRYLGVYFAKGMREVEVRGCHGRFWGESRRKYSHVSLARVICDIEQSAFFLVCAESLCSWKKGKGLLPPTTYMCLNSSRFRGVYQCKRDRAPHCHHSQSDLFASITSRAKTLSHRDNKSPFPPQPWINKILKTRKEEAL